MHLTVSIDGSKKGAATTTTTITIAGRSSLTVAACPPQQNRSALDALPHRNRGERIVMAGIIDEGR